MLGRLTRSIVIRNDSTWIERLLWILGVFALVMLVALVVLRFWVADAIVRWHVVRGLSKVWDGEVSATSVQLNDSGLICLGGLVLSDDRGREWLRISAAKLTLAKWPTLRPVINEVQVDGLDLQIHVAEAKSATSLRLASKRRTALRSKYLDIRKLTVKEAVIRVTHGNETITVCDNLVLSATRKGTFYDVLLKQAVPEDSELFAAEGRIDSRTLGVDISLQVEHTCNKAETAALLAALDVPELSAEGRLTAALAIAGPLEKPGTLQPTGTVKLEDWTVYSQDGVSAANFGTVVKLDGPDISLENVAVHDVNGPECLSAQSLELILKGWPGPEPVLTGLHMRGLRVQAYLAGSKLQIPVKWPRRRPMPTENGRSGLETIIVRDAFVGVTDQKGRKISVDNLSLRAERQKETYDIALTGTSPGDANMISVSGTVNPMTSEIALLLQTKMDVTETAMAMVLAALNVPGLSGGGKLAADLTIAGCLKKPVTLQPKGTIKLGDWIVGSKEMVSGHNLSTVVRLDGSEVCLEDFGLRDANGVQWLSAKTMRMALADWPGLQPVLTGIDVSGLQLEALLAKGRPWVPAKLPVRTSGRTGGKHIDLKELNIRNASISLANQKGAKVSFDNLSLQVGIRQNLYDIDLIYKVPGDPNQIRAIATFDRGTSELDLSAQAELIGGSTQMRALMSVLDIGHLAADSGTLAADLKIAGNVKKPETLQPKGTVRLSDWAAGSDGQAPSSRINVDVKLEGPRFRLENLAVCDANGLEWLSAQTSELTVENWPSRRPILTEIEINGLALRPYMVDAKPSFALPLSASESPKSWRDYVNLRKVVIREGSVAIASRKQAKITFDYLSVRPAEQENFYEFLLTADGAKGLGSVRLEGVVNPASSEGRLTVTADRKAEKSETAVVFAALGLPQVSGEGRLAADLTVTGNLNKPSALQSSGSVKFDEWVVLLGDKVLASKLFTTARFDGRSLGFDNFTAIVCGGQVSGSLQAELTQNRVLGFSGKLLAKNVNFPEFTSVLTADKTKAARGTFTLSYDFAGQSNELKKLKAEGLIFLDDADITVLPVVPNIFAAIGLRNYDPLRMSDAAARFDMVGPVLTFSSGHAANPVAAIVVEQGGTINLQTQGLDGHVVIAPLQKIEAVVRLIPLVEIVANIKDKLTRVRVKGQWSDPPAKLITKEPIRDIRDATVGFLRDVVKSSGQFGQSVLGRFGILFQPKKNDINK